MEEETDDVSSPTRESASSISSCVKFLDWRNAIRFSRGDEATEGSWRTADLLGSVDNRSRSKSGSNGDHIERTGNLAAGMIVSSSFNCVGSGVMETYS